MKTTNVLHVYLYHKQQKKATFCCRTERSVQEMKNIDIRLAIVNKRLKNYEVAAACGVSEFTFSRWLREELPQEKKKRILDVIESL